MIHRLATIFSTIMIVLISGLASGKDSLSHCDPETQIPVAARDAFYCQDPDYVMVYNMSSGFDAEIADDIPDEWAGYEVASITLWFGEWYTGGSQGWRDPVGLRVNLYHESCPPELVPYRSIEIAWDDLDKILIESTSSRWVYEVHVPLSPTLIVEPGTTLGATALIDWGQEEPFCGIVATPFWVSYGACPAYLDGQNWGYIRWTAIDEFTTINQDLAYCLEGPASAVPEADLANLRLSAWPNPFNPKTTISCSLEQSGSVILRIYDMTGRKVAILYNGWHEAGALSVDWNGRDDTGRSVAAGVYLVALQSGDQTSAVKVVLLE